MRESLAWLLQPRSYLVIVSLCLGLLLLHEWRMALVFVPRGRIDAELPVTAAATSRIPAFGAGSALPSAVGGRKRRRGPASGVGTRIHALDRDGLGEHVSLPAASHNAAPRTTWSANASSLAEGGALSGGAGRARHLALVLPYIDDQAPRISQMIRRWHRYPPCAARATLPATAYFYHPSSTSKIVGKLRQIWESMPAEVIQCFEGGMRTLYAQLPDRVGFVHPDGTCGQFYALFNILHEQVLAARLSVLISTALHCVRLFTHAGALLLPDGAGRAAHPRRLARSAREYGAVSAVHRVLGA